MRIIKKPTRKEEQLYYLTTLVAGGFALGDALDRLARGVVEITGASACSIRLLDDETGELKMRSTFGLSEEYRNKGPVTKDDPVIKAAFAGEAVIIDDMRDDARIKYPQASAKEGLISQLTVTMQFKNKPVGVLRLYRRRYCIGKVGSLAMRSGNYQRKILRKGDSGRTGRSAGKTGHPFS